MRHRVAGRGFSRPTAHRLMMYRNLVTDLLRYGAITTTLEKAKEIRSFAEKMVTHGKTGTLHARRLAEAYVLDKGVTKRLFDEIAPHFAGRPGGYTRITKLGPRKGDAASMARIELVDFAKAD